MNSLHASIKFTLDHSHNDKGVPFLDTLVTVTTDTSGATKLETELYIKPTNSGIVLHATSAHPTAVKHSMIRNMYHRALNNSSDDTKGEVSIEKVTRLLQGNGYSPQLLKRLLRDVRFSRRKNNRKTPKMGDDGYLTLPYIDEKLLHKVKYVVKKSGLNVRIAWRNENKLKNRLVHSSFTPPRCPGGTRCNLCKSDFVGQCTQKNVVYLLHCKLCRDDGVTADYVGETKRPLRLRYNEHLRDIMNRKEDTPMGDHFRTAHPGIDITAPPIGAKVLFRARDHPDRKIAESLFIRNLRPVLNSNVASWPIM